MNVLVAVRFELWQGWNAVQEAVGQDVFGMVFYQAWAEDAHITFAISANFASLIVNHQTLYFMKTSIFRAWRCMPLLC